MPCAGAIARRGGCGWTVICATGRPASSAPATTSTARWMPSSSCARERRKARLASRWLPAEAQVAGAVLVAAEPAVAAVPEVDGLAAQGVAAAAPALDPRAAGQLHLQPAVRALAHGGGDG